MNIIGQKLLLQDIDNLIEKDKFPRFIIIQGALGSGKKLISSYIADKLKALFIPCDISVESVREVIDLSYNQTEPIVYMWADSQNMSLAAKNSILKVTEEVPQNAYFILTVDNINNILATITSRGTVFNINPYSPQDIIDYAKYKNNQLSSKDLNIISNICTTPLDVQIMLESDITDFYNKITKLADNIDRVSLANILKISTFIKTKDIDDKGGNEEVKYNPILFMKAFMMYCSDRFYETSDYMYYTLIRLTNKYSADLLSKSLSKGMLIDNWLIDMYMQVTGGDN